MFGLCIISSFIFVVLNSKCPHLEDSDRSRKNSVAGLYSYLLEMPPLFLLKHIQNPPCSLRMFAGMLFSTAQQFSTDQLDSLLIGYPTFSSLRWLTPVIARLRLPQHHLLKNSPSLLVIHCLQHRFVLLVTPFAPDSGSVSSYCSPVVFPAISCFGQTFLLVHSSPCPQTCLPVLNCYLFSPLVPKLHSFCRTFRKFCTSGWADEKEEAEFQPNSVSLPIYLWKTAFLISSGLFICPISLPLSAAPSTVPIMHQVSATMRSMTLSCTARANGIILDYEIRRVLWEGKPAPPAGLQDLGPATVVWVVASWGDTGWREPWCEENLVTEARGSLRAQPGSAPAKVSGARVLLHQLRRRQLQHPTPLSGPLTGLSWMGKDQFHSPSHELATCVCWATNSPGVPELSEDFVTL